MIVYILRRIEGNKNSTNFLNVIINYHYHGENKVVTRKFKSMQKERGATDPPQEPIVLLWGK